jgi:hypothetical protein
MGVTDSENAEVSTPRHGMNLHRLIKLGIPNTDAPVVAVGDPLLALGIGGEGN